MINIQVLLVLTELEGFYLTQTSQEMGNSDVPFPCGANHYSLNLPPAFTLLAVLMKTPASSKGSPGQHHVGPRFHLLLWPVLELSHHTSKTSLHRTSVQSLSTIQETGDNIIFLAFSLQWWICGICCHLSLLIKLLVLAVMALQDVAHPFVPCRVPYFMINSCLQSASSATWPLSHLQSKSKFYSLLTKSFFIGSCRVTVLYVSISPIKALPEGPTNHRPWTRTQHTTSYEWRVPCSSIFCGHVSVSDNPVVLWQTPRQSAYPLKYKSSGDTGRCCCKRHSKHLDPNSVLWSILQHLSFSTEDHGAGSVTGWASAQVAKTPELKE